MAETDDYIDWARLGLQYYQSQKQPKFKTPPLTPEQKQVWDLYYQSLQNPAIKNNAANVQGMSSQILQGYQNMSWNAPKTIQNRGGVNPGPAGYAGSRTSFTPPPAMGSQAPVVPGATPQPAPRQNGGSGIGGAESGGTAPMAEMQGQRRPSGVPDFGGWVSVGDGRQGAGVSGSPVDTQGLRETFGRIDQAWDSFRASHPTLANLTQGAITALATTLGLPLALVARWAFNRMNAPEGGSSKNPAPFNNIDGGVSEGYMGGPGAPMGGEQLPAPVYGQYDLTPRKP
jgi:hypothetical protein